MDLNRKPTRDDREDEYNESRLFVQRGINEHGISMPGGDGSVDDPEELSSTSSIGREQPGNLRDPESEAADKSPLYGQGFGQGVDGSYVAQRKAQTGKDPIEEGTRGARKGPDSIAGQGPQRSASTSGSGEPDPRQGDGKDYTA